MSEPDLGNAFGTSAAALANRLAKRSPQAGPAPAAPQAAPAAPPAAEKSAPAPEREPAPAQEKDEQADERPRHRAVSPTTEQVRRPVKRAPKKAAPRTPEPASQAVDVAAGSTVQVSVYLLPAALQAVRRKVRETRRTNADIAFAAIDATHEQLRELVTQRRTVPREEGSLFPSRVRNRSTADSDRRILWSMQATPGELEVVDRLVDESGAASRSELIAVAIEAHLL